MVGQAPARSALPEKQRRMNLHNGSRIINRSILFRAFSQFAAGFIYFKTVNFTLDVRIVGSRAIMAGAARADCRTQREGF